MRPLRPLQLLRAALLACALAGFAGCSHYHLGKSAAPAFHTVYVAPVVNVAFAPQAAPLVATQVRNAFATDGRVALGTGPESAEVTLAVKLLTYSREVVAARRSDTGLARKFAVTLTAEFTVTDRAGTVLVDRRPLQVTREIFTDSGQQQAEYENMPLLAEALARELVHSVLDTW